MDDTEARAARAALAALMAEQSGVIARRQALGLGLTPADIERRLRRREWARCVPGVFVDHTGAPTWRQRAWTGVLRHHPAALARESALRAMLGPQWQSDDAPIRLIVPAGRHLEASAGYHLTRCRAFPVATQQASPPRQRIEEAAVDLAVSRRTELASIATLADVCQTQRTTAARLRATLAGRPRVARRGWLDAVLLDLERGTCSVLEHGYLTRIEQPHGLPTGARQAPAVTSAGRVRRDVDYHPIPLLVELDGRIFHDNADQRDRDLDRDLVALADDRRLTVRLGWGQVYDRPCLTAHRVAAVLTAAGWVEPMRRCPSCPTES